MAWISKMFSGLQLVWAIIKRGPEALRSQNEAEWLVLGSLTLSDLEQRLGHGS